LYGTALVLPGLRAVGFDMSHPRILKSGQWLVSKQSPDGGWGESCGSYMDDSLRAAGPNTASQTAWALIGLLAIDKPQFDEAIERGLDWLLKSQKTGTWDEPHYVGCGFPGYGIGERLDLQKNTARLAQGRELARGFMINYNLYRHYFPMQALGRALEKYRGRQFHARASDTSDSQIQVLAK
jgi:squalene-hopene/tetraprenyl-beta-curcumene cyclase